MSPTHFIDRPKLAFVISILITLAGIISAFRLPIDQFPDITPPVVQVSASYPGANSEVVETSIAQPIEERVNGVDGMLYLASQSGNDGTYTLQVTFEVGTDPDIAQVNVQNRVALATPRLPEDVTRQGITVRKQSTNLLLVVNVTSPDNSRDSLFLSNYAGINLVDRLARIPGVGQVTIFGERAYSMRVWLDPARMASLGITTADVIAAIREQNVQVAAGQVGGEPTDLDPPFQYTVRTQGRLSDAEAFGAIILRANPGGSSVRLRDLARVELGAQSYATFGLLDGKPSANIGLYQLPGSNALAVARAVQAEIDRLAPEFPTGLKASILYDTTRFIEASVSQVAWTLIEALSLVILVVYVFLQDWRMTLIPACAIPVSLIGTFAALGALGFSINTITLFALVLAIGIVVDDAIVVVENVQRKLGDGLQPRDATVAAMREVTAPIITTTLVLIAVFVPVGFIPGVSGQLYQQFALTLAVAVFISMINALTLSPALCVSVLRPHEEAAGGVFRLFNRGFSAVQRRYASLVHWLMRRLVATMFVFIALVTVTAVGFVNLPTAFLPEEDQGYFFVNIQLPPAASLARTADVLDKVVDILRVTPGVAHAVGVGGFSFLTGTAASNAAVTFAVLEPWSARREASQKAQAIVNRLRGEFAAIPEAEIVAFNPPSIRGLGTVGGFDFQLQDRAGGSPQDLAAALRALIVEANQQPALRNVFSTFQADSPQVWVDVDREKAKSLGIPLSEIFLALQAHLGSFYVNDFNKFGRVYRVQIQADQEFRSRPDDILRHYVRNRDGEMVPLRTLVKLSSTLAPETIRRFNLFRAAQVNGEAAPGVGSSEAIAAMERTAAAVLPRSMGFEWAGATLQELRAGQMAPILLILAIVFAYLFLVAQYESWTLPFAVILCVPLAALGAVAGLTLTGIAGDLYAQIGMVLLIGLAAKNAILIVEFATVRERGGEDAATAARIAGSLRFRAIVMTALTFILGVVPLLLAAGAGAASRQSLGTTVFSGMIAVTAVGTLLVPAFYLAVRRVTAARGAQCNGAATTERAT